MADYADPMPDETPVGGAMSDEELAQHLAEHESRAIGYFESEIAAEQAEALKRYYRRPYGDERAGRSKVVSGLLATVCDNALAAILKPFVSSDETVAFEPRGKEDEEQAQQATEYVNYVLHHDNCGFQILHDWFKDALLQKVGVVKAYWEDRTRSKAVRLESLDPLQLQQIMAEEQVIDGPFGPDENGLFTVDVMHTDPDGKLCVENIPPEEYRISPFARPGQVAPYEGHCTVKARSELIELGFDPAVVETLDKSSSTLADSRAIARRQDEGWESHGSAQPPGDPSRELVDFNDEYVLIDYDGDGISELRHVIRSGDTILFNEEVEHGPFARLCPAPMPHKIYGLSLADQLIDETRIDTVVWRQTLDNLYLANNPRPVVTDAAERDDGSTIEDLLSDAPGALIRTANDPIVPFAVPFVGHQSFPMLEYVSAQAEARTGISKHGQGMDPEAIDKAGQVTATQAAIMQDGRNARAEMISRIFAETGVKDLFKMMLRMLVAHQPRARMIRLRNKWVEMDPREWNADMDVSISVGLGTGNRAEQLSMAQAVLEGMERIAQTPFGSMISKEHVYNGWKKFLNAAGIKNVDDFAAEPQKDEQGNVVQDPPQPSPEEQKLQAEMQMKAAELQMKQAESEQKAQLAQAEAAAKIQLEREKAQAEMVMNEQRMAAELELERERLRMQHEVAMHAASLKEEQTARDNDRKDKEAESKIKRNRSGGDLDK